MGRRRQAAPTAQAGDGEEQGSASHRATRCGVRCGEGRTPALGRALAGGEGRAIDAARDWKAERAERPARAERKADEKEQQQQQQAQKQADECARLEDAQLLEKHAAVRPSARQLAEVAARRRRQWASRARTSAAADSESSGSSNGGESDDSRQSVDSDGDVKPRRRRRHRRVIATPDW